MLSASTVLLMCGLRWIVSINQGLYPCSTAFDETKCIVQVTCEDEQLELDCSKTSPQSRSLHVMNEFAAAVSCSKEIK